MQEEVTEKITGYSLDMMLVNTNLVIEVCTSVHLHHFLSQQACQKLTDEYVWCVRACVRACVHARARVLVCGVGGRQVDGPSHYARGSRIPLGATVMKRRQVCASSRMLTYAHVC